MSNVACAREQNAPRDVAHFLVHYGETKMVGEWCRLLLRDPLINQESLYSNQTEPRSGIPEIKSEGRHYRQLYCAGGMQAPPQDRISRRPTRRPHSRVYWGEAKGKGVLLRWDPRRFSRLGRQAIKLNGPRRRIVRAPLGRPNLGDRSALFVEPQGDRFASPNRVQRFRKRTSAPCCMPRQPSLYMQHTEGVSTMAARYTANFFNRMPLVILCFN